MTMSADELRKRATEHLIADYAANIELRVMAPESCPSCAYGLEPDDWQFFIVRGGMAAWEMRLDASHVVAVHKHNGQVLDLGQRMVF